MSDGAKAFLVDKGFDRKLGARPLKRVIQREVEDALAEGLIKGEYRDGETILVDGTEEGLTFRVLQEEEPQEAGVNP
jgi:ATP-dependent Clp protease ATP-binding subunit ClpA